jgi:hypothetical protein
VHFRSLYLATVANDVTGNYNLTLRLTWRIVPGTERSWAINR